MIHVKLLILFFSVFFTLFTLIETANSIGKGYEKPNIGLYFLALITAVLWTLFYALTQIT